MATGLCDIDSYSNCNSLNNSTWVVYARIDIPFCNGAEAGRWVCGGGDGYFRCPVSIENDKNQSKCGVGNPINHSTGSKYLREQDLLLPGRLLGFSRVYTSMQPLGAGAYATPWRQIARALPRGGLGIGWRHEFSSYIHVVGDGQPDYGQYLRDYVVIGRPTGDFLRFRRDSFTGAWSATADISLRLSDDPLRYFLLDQQAGRLEVFDRLSGRLTGIWSLDGRSVALAYDGNGLKSVTDAFGRALQFETLQGSVQSIVDPVGSVYRYSYDASRNLASVTYPDGVRRLYHYGELDNTAGTPLPHSLTGISVESALGQPVRRSNYQYASNGLAILTEAAGGIERYTVAYPSVGASATVVDPLGASRSYSFANRLGALFPSGQSQPGGSGCGPASESVSYDAQGNPVRRVDFNGNATCAAFDLGRNLETRRVEGLAPTADCGAALLNPPAGDAVRVVSTEWHPRWKLAVRTAEPRRIVTEIYHGRPDPTASGAIASCAPVDAVLPDGQPIAVRCKRIEQATVDETGRDGLAAVTVGSPRVWTWTYNRWGQVLTENGPRTDVADVTTTAYYADTTADWTVGDIRSVTNAAGHVTRFTRYDRAGRVLERIDPNGAVTLFAYDPRGRLVRETVNGRSTTYQYDAAGNLVRTARPDGGWLQMSYDAADRLIGAVDHRGTTVAFTLDAMGNRVREDVRDSGGNPIRDTARVIDALNRVQQQIGGR